MDPYQILDIFDDHFFEMDVEFLGMARIKETKMKLLKGPRIAKYDQSMAIEGNMNLLNRNWFYWFDARFQKEYSILVKNSHSNEYNPSYLRNLEDIDFNIIKENEFFRSMFFVDLDYFKNNLKSISIKIMDSFTRMENSIGVCEYVPLWEELKSNVQTMGGSGVLNWRKPNPLKIRDFYYGNGVIICLNTIEI